MQFVRLRCFWLLLVIGSFRPAVLIIGWFPFIFRAPAPPYRRSLATFPPCFSSLRCGLDVALFGQAFPPSLLQLNTCRSSRTAVVSPEFSVIAAYACLSLATRGMARDVHSSASLGPPRFSFSFSDHLFSHSSVRAFRFHCCLSLGPHSNYRRRPNSSLARSFALPFLPEPRHSISPNRNPPASRIQPRNGTFDRPDQTQTRQALPARRGPPSTPPQFSLTISDPGLPFRGCIPLISNVLGTSANSGATRSGPAHSTVRANEVRLAFFRRANRLLGTS